MTKYIYPFIPTLCECSPYCGEIAPYDRNAGKYCKYVDGHGGRGRNNGMFGRKHTDESIKIIRNEANKTAKTRGLKLLGHGVSASTRQKISKKKKGTHVGKENHMYGRLPSEKSGRGKRSYYPSPLQGQVCFRSSYELAYAKYLDSIHELWMYEMETFDLGNTTYTPDFFLPRLEKFIEIKGYMNEKSKAQIQQFQEQYS